MYYLQRSNPDKLGTQEVQLQPVALAHHSFNKLRGTDQCRVFANLALPDNYKRPTLRLKCKIITGISCFVAFQLARPKFTPRFRNMSDLAVVQVPEASAYLNCQLGTRKNDVRRTRKATHMEPVTQARGM
jgi:hypothetical protein